MMKERIASYRLQLHADFTLHDAAALLPYLRQLGISHVYLSPVFAARPGSQHGYDVVDMNEINLELGGQEAFDRFLNQAQELGVWILLDIVPNHCAFNSGNRRLMDVFEKGPFSKYYEFFDIAWDHPYFNIQQKVLAPFLGDFYVHCLERGEIQLGYGADGFFVSYFTFKLPLALKSYAGLLKRCSQKMRPASFETATRFYAVIQLVSNLEQEMTLTPDFDHGPFIKEILWELYGGDEGIKRQLDELVTEYNDFASRELLDALLEEQYFRLAFWKVGTQELNYRRFFSINDLISIKTENEWVRDEWHALVYELVRGKRVDGLRIDHVDGLYDPLSYLRALRRLDPDLYLVVEKILEPGENLPQSWPIQGTTGYDFMDVAAGALCDQGADNHLDIVYRKFSGLEEPVRALIRTRKRNIAGRHMAGDIDNLALLLKSISNRTLRGKDLTMSALRRALIEILTVFPVYRAYVNEQEFSTVDRAVFKNVIASAAKSLPYFREELQLIGSFIEGAYEGTLGAAEREDWTRFVMRLQQYTGPLMAKGVEDTAFYLYNRLLSRNEVGSDPALLGYSVQYFHDFMQRRRSDWPDTMNALGTHDMKRGEDARARLYTIAEGVDEWEEQLAIWEKMNSKHKTRVDGRDMPTKNDEYLLYQSILGAVPFAGLDAAGFLGRLKDFLVKASREAKEETDWLSPDEEYEKALVQFAEAVLSPRNTKFRAVFEDFRRRISNFGMHNSLAQIVLRHTCPGVPDLYQGSELWDLSFVDPDNRRPVDYDLRRQLLVDIQQRAGEDRRGLIDWLLGEPENGAVKLFVIHELLQLRRLTPALFAQGAYQALEVSGEKSANIIAFARRSGEQQLVVIVPRLLTQVMTSASLRASRDEWVDTSVKLPISAEQQIELFTLQRVKQSQDGGVDAGELLSRFPVAVLTNFPGHEQGGR